MPITRLILVLSFFLSLSLSYGQEFEVFSENGERGVRRKNGEKLFSSNYDFIGWSDGSSIFSGEYIGYQKNGFWGLVNNKGRQITSALYRSLYNTGENFYVASTLGKFSKKVLYGALDSKGRVVVSFRYNLFERCYGDFFIVAEDIDGREQFGVLSSKSERIIPIVYQWVEPLGKSQFLVKSFAGRFGVLDFVGEVILPVIYDEINLINKEQFLLEKDGLMGTADRSGQMQQSMVVKSIDRTGAIQKFPTWTIRNDNNEVAEKALADSVELLSEGRYLLHRNNRQVIYNSRTAISKKIEGLDLSDVLDDAVIVKTEKGLKVLSLKGRELLPGTYDSIFYDSQYYYVWSSRKDSKWTLFSRTGTQLSNRSLDALLPTSGNRIRYQKEGFWGLMDFDGTILSHPKYDTILPFFHRKALVSQLGLWGLLDDQNQWVILPYEDSLEMINKDLYVSKKGYHLKFYNAQGSHIRSITTSYGLLGDYVWIKGEMGKMGLMDYSGRAITSIAYDTIIEIPNNDDLFAVSIENATGLIDANERVILPLDSSLNKIVGVSESKIGVQIDGKYGFLNMQGKLIISNRYDNVQLFSEGMAPYQLNGKWGFLNSQEQLVVQPYYQEILPYRSGVAPVKYDGKWGFIDKAANVLIDYQYETLVRTDEYRYVVTKNGKQGLISEGGELLLNPQYEVLHDIGREMAIVKKNGKWGVLRYDGSYVIPTLYDAIECKEEKFLIKERG